MYEDFAQSESPTIDPEELKRIPELIKISKELQEEKKSVGQLQERKERLSKEIKDQFEEMHQLEKEMGLALAEFKKQEDVFRQLDSQVEEIKQNQNSKQKNRMNPTKQKIDPTKYLKKKASQEKGEVRKEESPSKAKKRHQGYDFKNNDFYDM